MPQVIDVIDCRGRRVHCPDETWRNKILKSRPWMSKYVDVVRRAIESPSWICQDANHKNREVYYLMYGAGKEKYVKVVAKFNARGEGVVFSAFFADSGKKNERMLWP